jgi:hypothetical protein
MDSGVFPGTPENINIIHRFYGYIRFSKIKKGPFLFLVIIKNKERKRYNLNLLLLTGASIF